MATNTTFYSSTSLPQVKDDTTLDSYSKDVNIALNDILSKINKVSSSTTTTSISVSAISGRAPLTQTAANFTSKNPVLVAGQLGYEIDTKFFKFGDGTTAWTSLSYQSVKNAPLPQTVAGVGQILTMQIAANTAFYLTSNGLVGGVALPGTWYYHVQTSNTTNYLVGNITNDFVGIAAGGTQIAPAPGAGFFIQASMERIT